MEDFFIAFLEALTVLIVYFGVVILISKALGISNLGGKNADT
jgi:hypothetical protein